MGNIISKKKKCYKQVVIFRWCRKNGNVYYLTVCRNLNHFCDFYSNVPKSFLKNLIYAFIFEITYFCFLINVLSWLVKVHLEMWCNTVILFSNTCLSLSQERQVNSIEIFNSTSLNLHDVINIDKDHFEQMVDKIYPKRIQLNRTNTSDTEAIVSV